MSRHFNTDCSPDSTRQVELLKDCGQVQCGKLERVMGQIRYHEDNKYIHVLFHN